MMEIPLELRGILVITGKNLRLYYTKPPVLMFGLLFPLFMFFVFFVGRKPDLATFFPAFLAMMLFFTASMRPCLGHRYFHRLLTAACSPVSLPGLSSLHGSSGNGI